MRPFFGGHRPADVNSALLRRFIEQKLGEKLSSTSVGHCVRTLSSLYTDLVERGYVAANPVSSLPRSTRRLYRNAHDPKDTAFLEKLEDVRRLFEELPEPIAVAFVIGAMAGLRTGEILGIEWAHIDLRARRIQVRQQVRHGKLGPVKDNESRTVPIVTPLLPILESYRAKTGGQGFVFRPMVTGKGGTKTRAATFLGIHTLHDHFARALETLKLSPLTWYQATRHTFASQFVLSGGSIEKLSKIMGHSDITTTQRYAHLRPDLFRLEDVDRFAVNFTGKTEATERAPGKSSGKTSDGKRAKLVTKLVTVRVSGGGAIDVNT
jgi:integrase